MVYLGFALVYVKRNFKLLILRPYVDKVTLFRLTYKCGQSIDILKQHAEEQKFRLKGGIVSKFRVTRIAEEEGIFSPDEH